jgi:hypothetical protein
MLAAIHSHEKGVDILDDRLWKDADVRLTLVCGRGAHVFLPVGSTGFPRKMQQIAVAPSRKRSMQHMINSQGRIHAMMIIFPNLLPPGVVSADAPAVP